MLFFSLLPTSDITYWIKYFDNIKCYSDWLYLVFFSLKPETHIYFFLALRSYYYIFRKVFLFWTKHTTNILRSLYILHFTFNNRIPYCTLKFCKLNGLGGDEHWLSETTTLLRIMGKEICFHIIDPKLKPKRIGYKISMILSTCMCKRQDAQNWYSWPHEMGS